MPTTSIRVERKTHEQLLKLARAQGRTMTQIVGDAVSEYEKEQFWKKTREGYERMNADPEDRAAFDAEMALWDSTLQDGLEAFPYDEDE